MLGTKTKMPSDVLDYDITYEAWIESGDTITTVVTNVDPVGQLEVDSVQIASPDVKVWVSGGVDGATYHIDVTASTSGGRVKKECFKIKIKDC